MLDLEILAILLAPWAMMLIATRGLLRLPAAQHNPRLLWWLWMLPGLAYLAWVVKLLSDTARDPTSHNLWPLEMMTVLAVWCGFAIMVRVACRLARLIRGGGATIR